MEQINKLVNLSFLRKFTNNDEEKLKHYIRVYLSTAEKMFGDLDKNRDSISMEELYTRVHSLKPQTTYAGILGLPEILIEIETSIKNKAERAEIIERLDRAIHLNQRGMEELQTYLG